MAWGGVIRKAAGRTVVEKAPEAAFWLVLLLAVLLGGARAAEGFMPLMRAVLPGGFSEAMAEVQGTARVALRLHLPAAPNRFAPQVLTPVASRGFPAWLAQRVRYDALAAGEPVPASSRSAPAIAIVIDDLGNDVPETEQAIALPKRVTLAFLPYPDETPMLARAARRAGHQLMLHMPMEPDGTEDPGPMALRTDLSAGANIDRLDWALGRVPDAVGINNHMGSRFTADRMALIPVVAQLAGRGFFFLDSRTTAATLVVPLAHDFGVASAGRDVFLDDVQRAGYIEKQLAETERLARENGAAIAIGHPHDVTLAVLKVWCARAAARGYRLVTASTAIRLKTERAAERMSLAAR